MFVGRYTCEASNLAGVNGYSYDIVVYDPATITNTTLNQTTVKVIIETNFSTDCTVNAYPVADVCVNLDSSPYTQFQVVSDFLFYEYNLDI